MKKSVLIATTNKGKIEEISRILNSYGIQVRVPDEDLDVQEGECSFLDNAYRKAQAYYELYKAPTLADDSGLVIPALGGFPGVFSSRFYAHPFGGVENVAESKDVANVNKVLRLLRGRQDREAYFLCYMVFCTEEGGYFAQGRIDGNILEEPKGSHGFGYDPIFLPRGYNRSMAELEPKEKDRISHRGRAIKRLLKVLGWT